MCLAVPGRIQSIQGDDPLMKTGKVDFGGVMKEVSLAYIPGAAVGDYVLVHVGFAISKVDEDEARKTLELLREMGEIAAREDGEPGEAGP
ncbi:MAG: HypC/HybG/HupF family hydrogenase formation chaperone [Candidatus Eisenbacteria bacterium]